MSLDFEVLEMLIKNDHPLEHVAVDMLGDQFIMTNEFNVSSGGEYLDYPADELQEIRKKFDCLFDRQCIVLRDRPLGGLTGFVAQSWVKFFDVWRREVDGERPPENEQYALENGFG